MHVTAIIAAGGRGERFGGATFKQLVPIAGRVVLERSVALFVAHPEIDEVIVALPAEIAADPPSYLRTTAKRLAVVKGGSRRQDSVRHGFEAASPQSELFVVHDAARPFASAALVSRTLTAAAETGAAVAALASRDTVKRGARFVLETLPRESIFLAQTPQAFRRAVLVDALAIAQSGVEVTDEAGLAERAGHRVQLVEGEAGNIKITTREDLLIAEAIAAGSPRLSQPPASSARVGTGYDLHQLVSGRPLIVGGVTIPSDRGPLGHSDADVVCHAITDAILGAAGLGDIGRHFPDSDPRWQGASSLDLLARAVALVVERGYAIGNVDVTVILERPKIRDHIDAMRTAIAAAIAIEPGCVSIKGKTNEGLDATGRGEAIAAHAVALLAKM